MEKIGLLLFLAVLVKSNSDIPVEDGQLGVITALNDNTRHQYVNIREGDNWCWLHNKWENVRIVNPSWKADTLNYSLDTLTLNN